MFFRLTIILCFLTGVSQLSGQSDTLKAPARKPLPSVLGKSGKPDSLKATQQTGDTLKRPAHSQVKISDSGLNSKITFGSQDSQIIDVRNKRVNLFGSSKVLYESKELNADEVTLRMSENIAEAGRAAGKTKGPKPTFKDGDDLVKYERLRYNFQTEKGLLRGAIKQEGEFMVHGDRLKLLNEDDHEGHQETIINSYKGGITTCDHDEPHFGIRAKKMKFINEKLAVFGPSNLELGGVPTPIIIPFGFYPLVQGKSSGFIFPQNYQFNSRELGFGLLGFGWYFPISDYVHLSLTADFYTRGTHGIYARTSYYKRYKYRGSFNVTYNDRRFDGVETLIQDGVTMQMPTVISQKGFSISLDHKQDPKAHPFVNVGGRINIVGNNNQNRNFNDAQSVLQNRYNSNFYYRHSMPGTPFSLNVGVTHDQNTATNVVNITFPDVQLNMNTIYPFERKNRGGNEKAWYEKISFDYDVKMKSFVRTTDTTLFTRQMYEDIQTGMSHEFVTGFSTRVFKYFNVVPRASYDEVWVLNSIERDIVKTAEDQDSLVSDVVTGFDSYRTFNTGVSINTQLFGTAEFKKGWFRGIRHTMKPEVGYSYAPDTRSLYQDTLFYSDAERSPEIYSRFDNGPFGNPGLTELQSQMNFRINNIVEIKYFSKRDSTIKKAKLFDNITLSGNYNFAKDSVKWSTFTLNSTSRLFKGVSTLTTRWTFDPYLKEKGRTVNTFVWTENKKLVRLDRGQISLTNKLSFKKLREWFGKKPKNTSDNDRGEKDEEPDELINPGERDYALPGSSEVPQARQQRPREKTLGEMFESFSIDHNIVYAFMSDANGEVTSGITINSLNLRGSLVLTDNWNISIGNIGYDFVKNGITYPSVSFSRKLHCWDMIFSWFPSRDTYNFSIGVRSNALSFLKYNYGQNNFDGLGRRF